MAKTSTQRTQLTRERYRRSGMRLLQIWVPDTRSPAFAAEAERQSRVLGEWDRSPEGHETMDWIMANGVFGDDNETR